MFLDNQLPVRLCDKHASQQGGCSVYARVYEKLHVSIVVASRMSRDAQMKHHIARSNERPQQAPPNLVYDSRILFLLGGRRTQTQIKTTDYWFCALLGEVGVVARCSGLVPGYLLLITQIWRKFLFHCSDNLLSATTVKCNQYRFAQHHVALHTDNLGFSLVVSCPEIGARTVCVRHPPLIARSEWRNSFQEVSHGNRMLCMSKLTGVWFCSSSRAV